MELKAIPGGLKAVEGRAATGITAVFGNVDTQGDRFWPGSFSKTIQERRPKFRHLWNHDFMAPPIAHITDIKEVGRADLPDAVIVAAPDATGGLQVTREYLATPRGDEVLAGLKAGAINEMSFGFDAMPGKVAFTDQGQMQIREVYEVRLWDTSDVLWGANEATVGVKALLPLELLLKQLEAWLTEFKAGARHSKKDTENLNLIHHLAVDLGATVCAGKIEPGDDGAADDAAAKSRAAQALTLMRAQIDLWTL